MARATRLPDDFMLTLDRFAIAKTENVDPERTFEKFRDYWRSASGAHARKMDWDATWRNWCRNDRDRSNARAGPPSKKPARSADEIEAEERAKGILP